MVFSLLGIVYRRFAWWRKGGLWYREDLGALFRFPKDFGMRGSLALAALVAASGLGGCISTPSEVPEWFEARSVEQDASYPSLRDVPSGTTATVDAAHWDAVQSDVVAAGQAVRDNPRSQPATNTENPTEFLEEAREDLEETRASHEPY